jgi:hypothetical protein
MSHKKSFFEKLTGGISLTNEEENIEIEEEYLDSEEDEKYSNENNTGDSFDEEVGELAIDSWNTKI